MRSLGMRYSAGHLEGGEGGRRKCQEVPAQIEAEGFRNWRSGLVVRIPGSLSRLGL